MRHNEYIYPAEMALGCNHPFLAVAIISGAAFEDNLAPISGITICSVTIQGVDVPEVVRSRFKYCVAASIVTIPIFIIISPVKGLRRKCALNMKNNL